MQPRKTLLALLVLAIIGGLAFYVSRQPAPDKNHKLLQFEARRYRPDRVARSGPRPRHGARRSEPLAHRQAGSEPCRQQYRRRHRRRDRTSPGDRYGRDKSHRPRQLRTRESRHHRLRDDQRQARPAGNHGRLGYSGRQQRLFQNHRQARRDAHRLRLYGRRRPHAQGSALACPGRPDRRSNRSHRRHPTRWHRDSKSCARATAG